MATKPRFLSIQLLRFLAAASVFAFHLLPGQHLDRLAAAAVDLFFVISGYVMVMTTEQGMPSDLFLKRRVARIVPLYWVLTLVVFGGAVLGVTQYASTRAEVGALLGSLLFVPYARTDGAVAPLLHVGWSLNYEMLFYAVFAVSLAIAGARRVVLAACVVIALAAIGLCVPELTQQATALPAWAAVILGAWTAPIVAFFAVGMLIRPMHVALRARVSKSFPAAVGAWILATACLCLWMAWSAAWAWYGLAGAVVLAALVGEDALPRGLPDVVSRLGDSTYALYLIHPLCITAYLRFIAPRLDTSELLALAGLLGFALGVLVLADQIHQRFERPAQRLALRVMGASSG